MAAVVAVAVLAAAHFAVLKHALSTAEAVVTVVPYVPQFVIHYLIYAPFL